MVAEIVRVEDIPGGIGKGVTTLQPIAPSLLRQADADEPILPAEFLLGSVGDGRLKVIQPILVKVVVEGGQFIAEADELHEFGFGETRPEAIRDLQRAIVELHLSLSADEARLGTDLLSTLHKLREKLEAPGLRPIA